MNIDAKRFQMITDSLVTRCKAANTFAEVVGLGLHNVSGARIDHAINHLATDPQADNADALRVLQAQSDRLAAWVTELRINAARESSAGARAA